MAIERKWLSPALAGLAIAGLWSLTGCGGGGGGGGGGSNGPSFLALASPMEYGTLTTGSVNEIYPTVPANGVPVPAGSTAFTVPPAVFTAHGAATQTAITLNFNTTVLASSIFPLPPSVGTPPPTPSGQVGIALFIINGGAGAACVGNTVCLNIDQATFPAPGVAPATLRLLYDPDFNTTTPDALPTGDYVLVITNALRSSNGGPFCVASSASDCVNTYTPSLPFTVGGNTTALSLSQTTPIIPVLNESAAPINSEIVINFQDAVDFVTVCGQQTNVSALDPFISVPLPLNTPGPGITVTYNPPSDPVTATTQTPPTSLGYLFYMPDPILNPAQVRVRFITTTGLRGLNNPAQSVFQNYASNPLKFPIASQDPAQGGAILQLPPIQPVPGSFRGSNLVVSFANIQISVGTSVTDRSGNALAAAFSSTFNWAIGPAVARNPVPPDAAYIGRSSGGPVPFDHPGIGVLNLANTTGDNTLAPCSNVPVTYGAFVTGRLSVAGNPLATPAVLGVPLDMELGAWINGANHTSNPARATIIPGVPDDQNGIPPADLLVCLGAQPSAGPPFGSRLYVVDGTANSVKVFNSYDFTLITTLTGIASPTGLGMSPDLQFLYIANGNQGTVQRVFANPTSPNFHTIANTITVGAGPRAITVMPANEDIFVANFSENSLSVIRQATQVERVKFQVGLGPSEVTCTRRMLGMGLTNEYMAYVLCQFSNDIHIYESSGGAVLENQPNGRMIKQVGGFLSPKRGCWNWISYIGATTELGVFVANGNGSTVDELTLFNFTLSPPPGFPGPQGRRDFHIFKQFNGTSIAGTASPSDVTIDTMSGLYNVNVVGVTNNKGVVDPTIGGGAPSVVLVAYPGSGKVVSFDYNTPAILGSASVPGCDFLHTYYDQ